MNKKATVALRRFKNAQKLNERYKENKMTDMEAAIDFWDEDRFNN